MTDYVKSTNFTSKDSLASGNPLKIIKGSEFDIEFNNIATAVATKADINSPTFTGTPTAPTASYGTATVQVATTAFVQAALQALYPVGSVYINASVSTNPATLFGFGTWVSVGDGKVLVNQDTADTSFDVLGETGGSKDAVVVSHSHTGTTNTTSLTGSLYANAFNSASGSFSGTGIVSGTGINSGYSSGGGSANSGGTYNIDASHNHAFTTNSTGSSGTNANLQPYVVVKMWKRTA